MRHFATLLTLALCPWTVLGDISIIVQTNGGQLKQGATLTYVVSANPIPTEPLYLVLIGVVVPGQTGGRVFWPWSLNMNGMSPRQASITVPKGAPPKFYSVDIHTNGSIYTPLLATSNAFEIIADTPPTTQVNTNVVQTTKETTQQVIVTRTQQQTVVQPPPNTPAPPDPTTTAQTPQKPTTNNAVNSPTSNTASSNTGSTGGQSNPSASGSTLTPSPQTAVNIVSSDTAAPTPSADTALNDPPPAVTDEKKKSSAIGPAVGGAIGGIIVILLLLFLWRRQQKKKQERLAIDEMAESNARYRDADSGAATPALSPFANTFAAREFQPNRNHTGVSPFLLDSERSPPPTSPDPTMSSKYREAYGGGGGGHSGNTHHNNTSFGASTGYFESSSGAGGTSEQLRSERERVLGEISALRSRGGQAGSSAYAQSSVSAGSSGARDANDEEMRQRLDQLTQHVARLENALEQAVNVYEAPPTYHQAPSQRG